MRVWNMSEMNKKNSPGNHPALALCLNLVLFISVTVVAVTGVIFGAGDGQVGDHFFGIDYFKPFTNISNILAGISSFLMLVCIIRNIKNNTEEIPRWLTVFQFMTTTSLSLTMLVAAVFLAPMEVLDGGNYLTMFKDDMFFFHFLNPLLAIVLFIEVEKTYLFQKREWFWGILPTIIYSVIYFLMVVIFQKWDDFYDFSFGGNYSLAPIVLLIIYLLAFSLAKLLIYLHNKMPMEGFQSHAPLSV